jgi:hypothetical protein
MVGAQRAKPSAPPTLDGFTFVPHTYRFLGRHKLPVFFAEFRREKVGTTIGFPELVELEGRKLWCPIMQENRPKYEARAWILTMEVIGQKLRERYRQPNDLPPRLFALIEKLDEKLVRDTSAGTSKAA